MALFQFKSEQFVPASIDDVWDFISSPKNLKVITPDYMGFEITSDYKVDQMYPGQIITYKVSPLLGFKMNWVTEITHVQDRAFFVDEQRVGPYKIWHHQHHLEEVDGGVNMVDIISYAPPFGFIGQLMNTLVIRKKLKEIFTYRERAVERQFPNN